VPAGRPAGHPPFTWEASAEDALRMKNYHTMPDWRLSRILHRLEAYNGLGSRRHGIFTPYLWSGCQHYSRGKYVADGVWDPNAVSKQIGCGVILHQLQSRGEISLDMT
jgi:lysozyme family protein